jgi:hypothetical protein
LLLRARLASISQKKHLEFQNCQIDAKNPFVFDNNIIVDRGTESIVARMSREDTKPTGVSPNQEAKQEHQDEDKEDMTPAAVRVPGKNWMSSRGVQEDHLAIAQEDSNSHVDERKEANSTRTILQAQLVVEEDAERVAHQER